MTTDDNNHFTNNFGSHGRKVANTESEEINFQWHNTENKCGCWYVSDKTQPGMNKEGQVSISL